MSKAPASPEPKPAIHRRFVACTQSRGGIGKSTFAEGLITWLSFAGVPYGALDADQQNQTLSKRHPEQVKFFEATKTEADFLRFLQALPDVPVTVTDFPAQATDVLLAYAEHYGLTAFFEAHGIRPTLIIFAADDPAVKLSASDTVQFFREQADYLLVENPAKFDSEVFKRTPLCEWLLDHQTPTIRIPAVAAPTMEAWETLERKLKRYVPLNEACSHEGLHDLSRYELRFYRDQLFAQFEKHAARLLPDVGLIQTKVPRLAPLKVRAKSDLLTDAWIEAG
jgi:hypothetical protein